MKPPHAILTLMTLLAEDTQDSGSSFELGEAYLLNPSEGTTVAETYGSPADLINTILPNIFVFAGVLLFIAIIVAGFSMLLKPDDKKNTEAGKNAITYGITGFILLLAAYWIVQILEILTGVTILGGR